MAHDSQFLTVRRSIAAENLHTLKFCIYVVCTAEHAEPQFDHLRKAPWDLYYFQKKQSLALLISSVSKQPGVFMLEV